MIEYVRTGLRGALNVANVILVASVYRSKSVDSWLTPGTWYESALIGPDARGLVTHAAQQLLCVNTRTISYNQTCA